MIVTQKNTASANRMPVVSMYYGYVSAANLYRGSEAYRLRTNAKNSCKRLFSPPSTHPPFKLRAPNGCRGGAPRKLNAASPALQPHLYHRAGGGKSGTALSKRVSE